MLSPDPLFDTFDFRLDSACYDVRRRRMEAYITFTMPVNDFVEGVHDDLARGFDDHEDEDWKIEVLDIDEGPEIAWFSFAFEARSDEACRHLQERVATATFWFQTITNGDDRCAA